MYYKHFSVLADKAVGLNRNQRNIATALQLNNLIIIEHIIDSVLKDGISNKKYYRDLYFDCKNQIKNFVNIAYLTTS